MNWSNAYNLLTGEPAAQAALISLAWNCAALGGNTALLSNLLCNMLHPTGVFQMLDAAGEPVPTEALPLLPKLTRRFSGPGYLEQTGYIPAECEGL